MKNDFFSIVIPAYSEEENIHNLLKEIESVLKKLNFVSKVEPVETNILIFQLKKFINPNLFIDNMLKNDVKLISMGDNKLRLVTHKDYTNEMHDKFLDILINLKF